MPRSRGQTVIWRGLACAAGAGALAIAGCGSSDDEDSADKSAQIEASLIPALFLEAGDSIGCESRGPGEFVETETYSCALDDKKGGYGRGTVDVLLDNNADTLDWKATFQPAGNTLKGTARLVAEPAPSE